MAGEKKMLLKLLCSVVSSKDFSLLPFDAVPLLWLVDSVLRVAHDLSSGMNLSLFSYFIGDGGFAMFFFSVVTKLKVELFLLPLCMRLAFLVDLISVAGTILSLRLLVRLDIFMGLTLIPPMLLEVSVFCEWCLSFILNS